MANRNNQGKSKTRLYKIFCAMKNRCYNPSDHSYKYYGRKGIEICAEWYFDFSAFENWALNNGYAANLSINRIDSDSDYRPDNCEWTSRGDNSHLAVMDYWYARRSARSVQRKKGRESTNASVREAE